MLNYQTNRSSNTIVKGENGLDQVIADKFPIRINGIGGTKGQTFPLFYVCGFREAIDNFAVGMGSGCLPDVVIFSNEKDAKLYVHNTVINYQQFVANNLETIELLIKHRGLKKEGA